jgi:hypothetical protein
MTAFATVRDFLLEGEDSAVGTDRAPRPVLSRRPAVVVSTSLHGASGPAVAAAVAVAVSTGAERAALLIELGAGARGRRPTVLASAAARELEDSIRARGGAFGRAAARGSLCHLGAPVGDEGLGLVAELLAGSPPAALVLVHVPPELWPDVVDDPRLRPSGGLMSAELPADRALVALAVRELHDRGIRARVAGRPLGRVASRRALAGVEPGGEASRRASRLARGLVRGEAGQALPLVLGAAAVVIFTALVLTAIGGAITGKARAQRAADLAALSAARSMRDDLARLLAPALLANGAPNPAHLSKAEYLMRARRAGRTAARRNEVSARRLRIRFPDAGSFAPLRARARIAAELERDAVPGPRGRRGRRDLPVVARAEAEASAPAGWTGMPTMASGGGYSGPLAYRQGEGMRPDVAEAFDRMAAAASRDGVSLVVNSGFRSDAEQAELFEQNPNPTMVAPPGKSLHRCATELDLGPPSAYGWLARHAPRFGFVKRYSWVLTDFP